MRRNTVLGNAVHLISPYLYLKGYAVLAYKSRMKRLIHVRLRHGYIVLEASRYRLIHLMYNPECCIAVLDRINHDTHCKQIIDLIYGLVLVNHLLVNAKEMLNSAVHRRNYAIFLKLSLHVIDNLGYKCLSLASDHVHLGSYVIIDIRHNVLKCSIVKLNLKLTDTKTLCKRRVDIKCLSCLLITLLLRLILKSS